MIRTILGGIGVAALTAAMACSAAAQVKPGDDPANWRKVDPQNLLVLTIKRQDVIVELRPDMAPKHVEQIRKIARDGNYNLLPFHRVIDDFMAQGGEVSAVYMMDKPYPTIKAEFTFQRKPASQPVQWVGKDAEGNGIGYYQGLVISGQPDEGASLMADGAVKTWALHCPGITSMARTNDPDSADTQFFLMRQSHAALDASYTIWGRAVQGLDVIRGIKAGPEDKDGRLAPADADKLSKAQIAADIAEYKRPTVYVMRTDGPEFAKTIATAKAAGVPPDPCNLPPVPAVVEMPPPP
jgi:peptidylprolyl isomerase